MTPLRCLQAACFVLFWSTSSLAAPDVVLKSSADAIELSTAIAEELRALGVTVRAPTLSATEPPSVLISCDSNVLPVEIRVTEGTAESVYVVSGSIPTETAIRVSEVVRAHGLLGLIARPTLPKRSLWGSPPAAGAEDAPAPDPVHPRSQPAAPKPGVSAPNARSTSGPPPSGRLRTAAWVGAGAMILSGDLTPLPSVEWTLSQSVNRLMLALRGGIQAAATEAAEFNSVIELRTFHVGLDASYQLIHAGPVRLNAGVGASLLRFGISGRTYARGHRGTEREEWTPWVRASATAHLRLSEHVGLYADANVGTLFSELHLFGPTEQVAASGGQPMAAAMPLEVLGPLAVQVGTGLEVGWDF